MENPFTLHFEDTADITDIKFRDRAHDESKNIDSATIKSDNKTIRNPNQPSKPAVLKGL